MVLSDPLHQVFEKFMSRWPFLVRVHHIQQGWFLHILLYKSRPSSFMVYFPLFKLRQQEFSIVLSVDSFLIHLLGMHILFVSLLSFQYVLHELVEPVYIIKVFEVSAFRKLLFELVPPHSVGNWFALHLLPQGLHVELLLFSCLFLLFVIELVHIRLEDVLPFLLIQVFPALISCK